jgi:hypothetical protein
VIQQRTFPPVVFFGLASCKFAMSTDVAHPLPSVDRPLSPPAVSGTSAPRRARSLTYAAAVVLIYQHIPELREESDVVRRDSEENACLFCPCMSHHKKPFLVVRQVQDLKVHRNSATHKRRKHMAHRFMKPGVGRGREHVHLSLQRAVSILQASHR